MCCVGTALPVVSACSVVHSGGCGHVHLCKLSPTEIETKVMSVSEPPCRFCVCHQWTPAARKGAGTWVAFLSQAVCGQLFMVGLCLPRKKHPFLICTEAPAGLAGLAQSSLQDPWVTRTIWMRGWGLTVPRLSLLHGHYFVPYAHKTSAILPPGLMLMF